MASLQKNPISMLFLQKKNRGKLNYLHFHDFAYNGPKKIFLAFKAYVLQIGLFWDRLGWGINFKSNFNLSKTSLKIPYIIKYTYMVTKYIWQTYPKPARERGCESVRE